MGKPRGLAGTCLEVRKRVASMGGKAVWEKAKQEGRKIGFTSETARIARKKSGEIKRNYAEALKTSDSSTTKTPT